MIGAGLESPTGHRDGLVEVLENMAVHNNSLQPTPKALRALGPFASLGAA